jgi:hypothetical protein
MRMSTHFSEVLNKERPRSRRHEGFKELAGELTKVGIREGVLAKRKGGVEPKSPRDTGYTYNIDFHSRP